MRKIPSVLHFILPLGGDYKAMVQEEAEHMWPLGTELLAQESNLTMTWRHKGLSRNLKAACPLGSKYQL